MNVAVTERAWFIVTTQGLVVPEQLPPDQPVNVWPAPGVAVIVTLVPSPYPTSQMVVEVPQFSPVDVPDSVVPAGLDVTVPLPTTEPVSFHLALKADVSDVPL